MKKFVFGVVTTIAVQKVANLPVVRKCVRIQADKIGRRVTNKIINEFEQYVNTSKALKETN